MDATDRKLMNILQQGLPLRQDPYAGIGAALGLTRQEVTARIGALLKAGYIRRLGGMFDTVAMGYSSLLVGMSVPETLFADVARFVNACSGVTHNYRRNAALNMWFTLTVQHEEEKDAFLASLRQTFGLAEVYEFPKLRNFKLRVFFDMESG